MVTAVPIRSVTIASCSSFRPFLTPNKQQLKPLSHFHLTVLYLCTNDTIEPLNDNGVGTVPLLRLVTDDAARRRRGRRSHGVESGAAVCIVINQS